jgi:hypothetical protein
MLKKLLILGFPLMIAGHVGLASAGTSVLDFNWSGVSLDITKGTGTLQFLGDVTNVGTQIITDYDSVSESGFHAWSTELGPNQAAGSKDVVSAKMSEAGESRAVVQSYYAAAIDLAAGAKGVFKIPYAYQLDAKGAGDSRSFVQYSFETVNFQADGGGESIPTQVFQNSFSVSSGRADVGQGQIEIYLNNTSDGVLRFALYQTAEAGAFVQSAVPEPAAYMTMGGGLALLGLLSWRRRKAASHVVR